MKTEWKKFFLLIKREIFEFRSVRVVAVFGIFGLLQCLMMFSANEHGLMEDTIFLFMIGGLCTVITGFDLVTREREWHTIDLLLTQGISRGSLFWVKWTTTIVLSLMAALIFCLSTIIGTLLAGQSVLWENLLREFCVITLEMEAYAAIALVCSVVFRKPKSALITAMVIWVTFRPPVVSLLLISPIQNFLSLDKTATWRFVSFIPEFAFRLALDIHKGAPSEVTIPPGWPFLALTGYIIIGSFLSWVIFIHQDEPVA